MEFPADLTPINGQYHFVKNHNLRKAFIGGRGAGKTVAGAMNVLEHAKDGMAYLLAAPNKPMAQNCLQRFAMIAGRCGALSRHYQSTMMVTLRNGARLQAVWPKTCRGSTAQGLWIKEGVYLPHDFFMALLPCLKEQDSWIAFTHTPLPLEKTWVEEELTKRFYSISRMKTSENWKLPAGFEQSLREVMGYTYSLSQLDAEEVTAVDS